MKHIKLFENFLVEAAGIKTFIVKQDRDRGNGKHAIRYVVGTLEDLIGYFGYTLEIGNSHKRSINRNPKTIKAFIKALEDSYSEKEAALYNRTSIDLLDKIPDGTPESEISDLTKKNEGLLDDSFEKIAKLKAGDKIIFIDSEHYLDRGTGNKGLGKTLAGKEGVVKKVVNDDLVDVEVDGKEYKNVSNLVFDITEQK
jgi:hypothetical protein